MSERWKSQIFGGAVSVVVDTTDTIATATISSFSAISSQGSFSVFFSGPSLFGNKSQGLILDRALQMYLDKSHWNTLDRNLPYIESCEMNIEVEFLKNEPVEDWRNWISKLLNRKFSWDRLEFMASRIAKGDNDHPAIGLAKDFISDPEEGICYILEKLPNGILEEFSNESLRNIDKALTEFIQ